MQINSVVISSGHGLKVRGASGEFDEVDQARRVTDALADALQRRGIHAMTFHDDISTTQDQNLKTIVAAHNECARDLDISVHFNAYDCKAHGTEVLYVSQGELAEALSEAIAAVGFTNRGSKYRSDLYVLNNTDMPAVLLEVCFCDSPEDAAIYEKRFNDIIENIANVLAGEEDIGLPAPEEPDPTTYLFHVKGTCSYFGGPDDMGVSPSEGLAFHFEITEANQHLFLPLQPAGTTGLARRLNSRAVMYVACRWDYAVTPKEMLASGALKALVRNSKTGDALTAWPSDWGPHEEKDRPSGGSLASPDGRSRSRHG